MLNVLKIREKLRNFYIEDNHYGDLASGIFDNDAGGTATLFAKSDGIFCGGLIIEEGFNLVDQKISVELLFDDGTEIRKGDEIARIHGNVRSILTSERFVLNMVQRMSGIATMTKKLNDIIADTDATVTDTRKTTPGLGEFEKYAVTTGGGKNHRRTLNDGIMLKDNHISFMGSMTRAVERARAIQGPMDKIEVEIEDDLMLEEAIRNKVDIIMFDNCSPEWIKAHIGKVPEAIRTEASGGITEDTLRAYAESGVDYISVGALFHQQQALDFSLKVVY
ncbi:MAG TPA: carboxylating nicotinate-nucleotide diphosphorylase [Candidatus Salinicoccus stercoripullorum]|uniref:Probable nicotinate-nucleotide pyrophosphorylase [carboxylating] n=1 Tax=Candidatus Salinicoccus stercoripullorum TaxID=2838756 RepID=A0A9D1U0I8_9STAP|nr:carboxylating nicotinate-nucleotide diphosphorylase [Candidatus Salinicoccus stercoripullorum]